MVNTTKPNTDDISITNKRRLLAFALATLLMTSIITTIALGSIRNAYAQNGNNWYVGKGAQPNSYYTYKIQNADTDQGQPFTMNICFKQFNSIGTGKLNFGSRYVYLISLLM